VQKNVFKTGKGVRCWRFGEYSAQFDFLVGGFYFCRAHSGRLLFQFVRKGIRVQASEAPGQAQCRKIKNG
jgi:hypothetical protein